MCQFDATAKLRRNDVVEPVEQVFAADAVGHFPKGGRNHQRPQVGSVSGLVGPDEVCHAAQPSTCRAKPQAAPFAGQENCKVLCGTAILAVKHGQDARATFDFPTLQFSWFAGVPRKNCKSSFPRSAWERTASDAPRPLGWNRPCCNTLRRQWTRSVDRALRRRAS